MNMTLFAMILLLLVALLLIWVMYLSGQVRELKRDVERLKNYSPSSPSNMPDPQTHFIYDPAKFGHPDTMQLDDHLRFRLITLIRKGSKIKAIKELRIATNLSLKDAKDVVDRLEDSL
ncbi:hypothetical protein DCC85_10665 [Paenibacillus sp. CAA11]|uniref:ribosomal protein L7/L12 n=1 Tax=Paenibacillus sp. CAA11 TaxID=1532905 RepID=UPI000D379F79|nr:ribosomal protein L7/L12 [Paenibacillus sp. CAA11]AWB46899.1 hypothetical protein DCC85_10665 [Paenibacillus sp. CAA11]